ncbi:unnamed protein product [Dicrocoelium dendriticum]|nr:unnamed protein product [Dicrocoelium dendriticum]
MTTPHSWTPTYSSHLPTAPPPTNPPSRLPHAHHMCPRQPPRRHLDPATAHRRHPAKLDNARPQHPRPEPPPPTPPDGARRTRAHPATHIPTPHPIHHPPMSSGTSTLRARPAAPIRTRAPD